MQMSVIHSKDGIYTRGRPSASGLDPEAVQLYSTTPPTSLTRRGVRSLTVELSFHPSQLSRVTSFGVLGPEFRAY